MFLFAFDYRIEAKAGLTKKMEDKLKRQIKTTNLRQLYLWIVVASVGLVLSCFLWFHLVGMLSS